MSRIAIVGAGPTGLYTLLALQRAAQPLAITVYEQGPVAGLGFPYDHASNSVDMLSNISSLELPPVIEPLIDWLARKPADALRKLGVDPHTLSDRSYYPRVALGQYYTEQFDALVAQARGRGHTIEVRTGEKVQDVRPQHSGYLVVTDTGMEPFEKVVIATGHQWHADSDLPAQIIHNSQLWPLLDRMDCTAVGVLGTSLSAIDVAVAVAGQHGTFAPAQAPFLTYVKRPVAPAFHVTLMSRGGILPEADFFHTLPYVPLRLFTEQAVETEIAAGQDGLLDRTFQLFAQQLALEDAAYMAALGLDATTPEGFGKAYFRARHSTHWSSYARANLQEAADNHAAQRTVAWRYAILRMHEAFSLVVPHLSAPDLARFNSGLKAMFADNYAAVPLLSIARLLALHDAGVLDVISLGKDYTLNAVGEQFKVTWAGGVRRFTEMVDARGQRQLDVDSLPFPTLRLFFKANANARTPSGTDKRDDVMIGDDAAVAPGINLLKDLYFWGLPYLLGQRPFIQGLVASHEIGEAIADSILKSEQGDATEDARHLAEMKAALLEDMDSVIYMDGAIVNT